MKNRVIRKITKIAGLALAAMLFVNVPMMKVEAEQQYDIASENVEVIDVVVKALSEEDLAQSSKARTGLYNCLINVICDSAGMHVDFLVHANGTASVIGIKDIKIQKKVWYGWKTVATSSGAEAKNVGSFGCSLLYTGAEYGQTYRITCTHYANVDGYTEVKNEIDSFVFTY